jgi:transposase
VSMLEHTLKPEGVRRLEVITGTGRRRRFSAGDKARVIEETLVPGAVVSEVARRHGLTPQQLFGWRRQARRPAATSPDTEALQFVPAVVEAALPARAVRRRKRNVDRTSGIIEVEIDGVTVRVGRGAEAKTVAAEPRASSRAQHHVIDAVQDRVGGSNPFPLRHQFFSSPAICARQARPRQAKRSAAPHA